MSEDKYLDIKQIQEIELELMKKFHNYCEKHSLHYCLAWGSLLGAVRHNGFIPWDNDMDIMMPRDDYEKLFFLEEKENIANDVSLYRNNKKPDYPYYFMRIVDNSTQVEMEYLRNPIKKMGVWIDIFPVDGYIPSKYIIQRPVINALIKLWTSNTYLPKTDNKIKLLLKQIILFFSSINFAKQIDKLSKKSSYNKAKLVTILTDYYEKGTSPRKYAFLKKEIEQAELHKFEDTFFYVPKNKEKLLESYYGDYMTWPKPENRFTHEIKVIKL